MNEWLLRFRSLLFVFRFVNILKSQTGLIQRVRFYDAVIVAAFSLIIIL